MPTSKAASVLLRFIGNLLNKMESSSGAYLKVVLIGEPGVGKTALLDCYNYKKITKT